MTRKTRPWRAFCRCRVTELSRQRRGRCSELEQLLERGALRDSVFVASYGLLDRDEAQRGRFQSSERRPRRDPRPTTSKPLTRDGLPHVSELEPITPGSKAPDGDPSARPCAMPSFKSLGVLRLRYYAQLLQRFVARDTALLGPGAFLTLVDQSGRYLAQRLGAARRGPQRGARLARAVAQDSAISARCRCSRRTLRLGGVRRRARAKGGGQQAPTQTRRRVAVVRPNAAFMAPVEEQLVSAGLVALGVAVFAVLAAVFFGTRVAAPITCG